MELGIYTFGDLVADPRTGHTLSAGERVRDMLAMARLAEMPRAAYDQMLSPQGALVGGSPQEVVDKILGQHEALGAHRYFGQIDIGGQPFAEVARGIELFATKVAPIVRKATGRKSS
jgi:hypothetical protein